MLAGEPHPPYHRPACSKGLLTGRQRLADTHLSTTAPARWLPARMLSSAAAVVSRVLVVEQLAASNHVLASSNRQVCFFIRIAYPHDTLLSDGTGLHPSAAAVGAPVLH